jgi:hypothetical protein
MKLTGLQIESLALALCLFGFSGWLWRRPLPSRPSPFLTGTIEQRKKRLRLAAIFTFCFGAGIIYCFVLFIQRGQ